MRRRLLTTAAVFFMGTAISFAQSAPADTANPQSTTAETNPASADAVNAAIANGTGKDYAGRPINNAQVPEVPPPPKPDEQRIEQDLREIHFDFDHAEIRPQDRATLESDAQWLKAHPQVLVTIDGDADERGDIVYNVALSDRRAIATRNALLSMGVPEDQLVFVTGWGKLYPVCTDSDEACWSRNRRAHFTEWGQAGQAQARVEAPPTGR